MNSLLLIRTDASAEIGAGHLMRCLALAQAWQEKRGGVIFVTTEKPPIENRLKEERFEVVGLSSVERGSLEDAKQFSALATQKNANWVVLDGYAFNAAYQKEIKAAGHRLLVIDDNSEEKHYYADFILNQNLYAHEALYEGKKGPSTRLLLGTDYALLRKEFLKWQTWKREIPKRACKLLMTLGGGNSLPFALEALRNLQNHKIKNLEIILVTGLTGSNEKELQIALKNFPSKISLKSHIPDLSEWMAWADVAISAGGTTCWELAFMGVPTITIILADNQEKNAQELAESGVSVNLGWHTKLSSSLEDSLKDLIENEKARSSMSRKGRALVDGEGSKRVVDAVRDGIKEVL